MADAIVHEVVAVPGPHDIVARAGMDDIRKSRPNPDIGKHCQVHMCHDFAPYDLVSTIKLALVLRPFLGRMKA
jgi:hypothetical protein